MAEVDEIRSGEGVSRTFVLIFVEMVETTSVETRRTADDAMHLVALLK